MRNLTIGGIAVIATITPITLGGIAGTCIDKYQASHMPADSTSFTVSSNFGIVVAGKPSALLLTGAGRDQVYSFGNTRELQPGTEQRAPYFITDAEAQRDLAKQTADMFEELCQPQNAATFANTKFYVMQVSKVEPAYEFRGEQQMPVGTPSMGLRYITAKYEPVFPTVAELAVVAKGWREASTSLLYAPPLTPMPLEHTVRLPKRNLGLMVGGTTGFVMGACLGLALLAGYTISSRSRA